MEGAIQHAAHLSPAFLPFGILGIDDDMEGAIQHAAHPTLHSIFLHKNIEKFIIMDFIFEHYI